MTTSEEFARYAEAERRICGEAGPAFAAIIRAVEANAGLLIGEVRVTFDRTTNTSELISANCTIVRATLVVPSDRHDTGARRESSKQQAAD